MPLSLCWLSPPFRQRVRGEARESLDFTLNGNRADRVQIVNGGRVARHVVKSDAGECDAEFLLRTGECRKHDLGLGRISLNCHLIAPIDNMRRHPSRTESSRFALCLV